MDFEMLAVVGCHVRVVVLPVTDAFAATSDSPKAAAISGPPKHPKMDTPSELLVGVKAA